MRGKTGLRQTQILVTKLIRLTIETGSVTGIYSHHLPLSKDQHYLRSAVGTLLVFILFFAFPHQTFYEAPAIITAELYANTVLMVLNSRIRIIGGRDTYTSDTDMIITTNMIRDMSFRSTEGTRPTDGMQGRVSVVTMTPEVFNDNHEMGRRKVSHDDSLVIRVLCLS